MKKILLIAVIALLSTVVILPNYFLKITSFYQDNYDYPLTGWIMAHNAATWKTGQVIEPKKYFQSNQFYPQKLTLAYSEHLFIPSLIFAPIFSITDNLIVATNITTLMTFILTFISCYFSFRLIIKDEASCLVGALIFTFNPLTLAHFPGHLQLLNRYFLPPFFVFMWRFFQNPTIRNSVMMFLFLTLNIFTCMYFAIFSSVILLIIFSAVIIYKLLSRDLYIVNKLIKSLIAALPFIIISILYFYPYLEVYRAESAIRSLQESINNSASLSDWLNFGNLFKNYYSFPEKVVYLNILPFVLFLVGMRYFLHNFKLFAAILFLSFVFSLGPNQDGIILPYYFFYKILPFLGAIRAPSRYQFIFYVPFALFAAQGFLLLKSRFKLRHNILLILFCLLLLIENVQLTSFDDTSLVHREITYLKKNSWSTFYKLQNKVTLHLPTYAFEDIGKDARYLIWSSYSQEITLNGYSGYYPPNQKKLLKDISSEKLKKINVDYVIFHKKFYASKSPAIIENLNIVYEDENVVIYKI
jgi:hypothetical protein